MKKFTKVMAIVLVVAMLFAFASCGAKEATTTTNKAANVKVGFIFLHDENSTYDKNFMDADLAGKSPLDVGGPGVEAIGEIKVKLEELFGTMAKEAAEKGGEAA